MTLQRATKIGIAGATIPLLTLPVQILLATVVGFRTAEIPGPNGMALVREYVGPLAILVFLVLLHRTAEGKLSTARLSDAALWICVVRIAGMALSLRWSDLQWFRGVQDYNIPWMWRLNWLMGGAVEPVAWLAFLVSFVRIPEEPPRRSTRRAAMWLALAILVSGVMPVYDAVVNAILSYWSYAPQQSGAFYSLDNTMLRSLFVVRWALLLNFAIAVWRCKPKPAGATPLPPGTSPETHFA